MKNALIIAVFFSCLVSGQEFILTPVNFVDKYNERKDHTIITFENQTQKQLFDKTKLFIFSRFKNLKGDGFNEIESRFIKLRSRTPGTSLKMLGSESLMSYLIITYEINFKDEKIMIKPIFNEFESNDLTGEKTYLTGGNSFSGKSIFNKSGKIWLPNYYDVANNNVDQFIRDLIEYLKKNNDWN